jgi:ATP/ADP translocase
MYPPWISKRLELIKVYADNKNGMFSQELKELFVQVIKSWQVIFITVVLVLYIYLVKYVSRSYHRPRMSKSKSKPKKAKTKEAAKPQGNPDELIVE